LAASNFAFGNMLLKGKSESNNLVNCKLSFMKTSSLVAVVCLSLTVTVVFSQKMVRFETDLSKGISKPVFDNYGTSGSINSVITNADKDAGINWQYTDGAAIGSKVKVSAQTGYTFTSWWLNDQRISLYGNTSTALWEVPITTDWEWAIDMTESGQWAVSAHNNIAQLFMTSSGVPFWELTVNGNIMGAKLSQDGSILFLADNNHNGTDSSYVSAYTVGNSTPLWQKAFFGNGTAFTKSKDDSRIVFCQYVGVNKMWVLDGASGEKIFDAYYYNENPPALSYDGTVILNGDYSGNAFLYKYDEYLETYIEKWTYKVGGGGTSAWVCGMGVSDDGSTVALGTLVFLASGYEGEIYMFNSYSPVPLWVFSGTGDEVSSIGISADGSLMAAASWGPMNQQKPDFYLFRKESDVPVFSINTPGSFFSADLSSDGTLCAVTGKAVHAREFGNGGLLYNIHSDPGGGIVAGSVDLENTMDESNAKIVINELEDYYNRSKPDGSYAIKYIPEGIFTVTASKIGYYPVTVQDVNVIEGETTTVNFELSETGNPPYGLYASKGAGLTVDMTWNYTNSSGLLGFNIYRKSLEEDIFPDEPLATVSNQTFGFSDHQVLPLTTYYYAVTGIIEAGVETPYSGISDGWMSTGFVTDEVSSYPGSIPVIDGTISPGEWDDAFMVDASDFLGKYDNTTNPVGSVTMYFKNNPGMTDLYVASINLNDSVLEDHDEVALYIDDNNDGVFPATGDSTEGNYWAAHYASGNVIRFRPIYNTGGVGYVYLLENPQIEVSDATGHIVYEFMVPIGTDANWKISPNIQNQSGLFMFTLDDPTGFDGYWPCQNPQIFSPMGYGQITFNAIDDVPSPPDQINIWWTDGPPYTVFIEWSQPDINDFDHFNVYYSVNAGNWELLTETIGRQLQYFSDNGDYTEFYVTTVDHSGQESEASATVVFDITIGISENKPWMNMNVFPNPASDRMSIVLEIVMAGFYDIHLINANRQTIRQLYCGQLAAGSRIFHLNATDNNDNPVPNGIYFLTVNGEGKNKSYKVVVMK
jgi:hypothetical protein